MKNKITLLALAAMVLTSFSAQADGRWPNWYVGLHGALAFVTDADTDGNPVIDSFSSDQGIGYGAAIGYRPASNNPIFNKFRFELEWHRQVADIDKVDTTLGNFSGNGETAVNAGLFNVYYDFVMNNTPFAPYVGAGLGLASVKLDGANATLGNTNDSDDVMAWQLMAGVSYAPQLIPYTEWTLGYRYFDTANPRYSYLGTGRFETDYSSHNLEAGVRFLF